MRAVSTNHRTRPRCLRQRTAPSWPLQRGIIGKRDTTLDPVILAGSIVQIDTQRRAISAGKDWTHEFQRLIYFLTTWDTYVCDLCELDLNSDWLTVIPTPHPVPAGNGGIEEN
jgi:hypothetical protein